MKTSMLLPASMFALALVLENGCVVAAGPPPPPAPIVETYTVAPYPEAVWVGGAWVWRPEYRRYEWRRGEWRHHGEGERFREERR